ncbi:aromatic acid exporter family protein [Peribacillus kribbensis]|uniref:aromatic acid exporter family protein n=1 Tax=Peribacillus kribbensis TaxID=356658 RepID=UPI0003FDF100|nr:aromatic acid exporter family protein [Peribacillus kribbensis]
MFRIGYRTLKTSIGTGLAIWLAQLAGLHNFASAGIITILCIQVTKKRSLRTSWDRFLACLIAMGFSSLFFEFLGYSPLVIGAMLLLFIPVTVALRVQGGIVTSSVIILHFYSAGQVSWQIFYNEVSLIIIGIGVALLMNLYMPSVDHKLMTYQEKIEENFHSIFKEIVHYLRTNEPLWSGQEITQLSLLLEEAKALASKEVENHFLRNEDTFYVYFKMREKQFEIIERILPLVSSIPASVKHSQKVADFVDELSNHIHPFNTAVIFLEKLSVMREEFSDMDLPKSREEFEIRAALLQLIKELELYLSIKDSYRGFPHEKTRIKPKITVNNKGKN